MTMLFDENPVSIGIRPKEHAESLFDYYNRSSRSDIRTIRYMLEGWFSRVPQPAKHDFRQRFRKQDDAPHRAALFELFLHELFTKSGFSLEIHPQVNGTSHPDFLVRKSGCDLFYLEATTAGASAEEVGEQRRIKQVYDSINRLKNTEFYLAVFVKGAPETPPKGARLRRDLERWLESLNWQTVRNRWDADAFDALPAFKWQHDGWDVIFKPIPKSEERLGEPSVTPIGITMPLQMQRLAPDEGIKKAIETKNKYCVNLPLLVAVNLVEDFCQTYDVMNALFGHETVAFAQNGTKPGARMHDGAWVGPCGPQNTTVSAALIFHDLQVWNIKQDRLWIVHNPWGTKPLDPALLPFTQYVPDREQGTLRRVDGCTTIGEVLGLPDPWPPEDQESEQSVFHTIRKKLSSLADRISVAFVYGSMANQKEQTQSDIDLMVIGKVTLEEIINQIADVERMSGHPVDPVVYSVAEFREKVASGNHFLTSVLRREKVFVIGDENDLKKVGGEQLAESRTHKS